MISVNWLTGVVFVPKAFMTQLGATLYRLDVNQLRLALKGLEDDEGITYPDTHRHNTAVTLSGVTYARVVEIINGYTVEFEDGQYAVQCVGANHNLADVKVLNSVSLIIGNAAGLVEVAGGAGGGALTPADVAAIVAAVEASAVLAKEATARQAVDMAQAGL